MKKRVKKVNMNTMFHAVITLNNGYHKTLRVARYVVAHIVTEFREYQKSIFKDVYKIIVNGQVFVLNEIKEIKFVYESSHDEYLTIS